MRSPRASARREVLRRVMDAKKRLDMLKYWWRADSRVWGESADAPSRERELSEYPEAQRRCWAGTVKEIAELITELRDLQEFCVHEYHKTPESGAAQTARRLAQAEGESES